MFGDQQTVLPPQGRLDTGHPAPDGRLNGIPGRLGADDYWAQWRRRKPPPPMARPRRGSYESSTGPARSAGCGCCTPTANRNAHTSRNNGSPRPARRSNMRSPFGRAGVPDERLATHLIHDHCRRRQRQLTSTSRMLACPRAAWFSDSMATCSRLAKLSLTAGSLCGAERSDEICVRGGQGHICC